MKKTKTDVLEILYKAYRKAPDEWVHAEFIRKKLKLNQEQLHDFVLALHDKKLIETNYLDDRALLKITPDGVAILVPEAYSEQESQKPDKTIEVAFIAPPSELSETYSELEEDSQEDEAFVSEEFPDFSWDILENNQFKHLPVVRRHDIITKITTVLNSRDNKQFIFLYEHQPRVGKDQVLKGLQERLSSTYIPVYMNFGGWSSIESQADFLAELAFNIQEEIEFLMPDIQIEPFNHTSEAQSTKEFARFMRSLTKTLHCGEKLFLFIFDELDYLQRFDADRRIFEYFRGFIRKYSRQARFIFAGSSDIFDVLEHKELVDLLGKGRPIAVECFVEEVSRELIMALTKPYFAVETNAVDMIFRLSDGHPELLKEVLEILIHYWEDHGREGQIRVQDVMNALDNNRTELSLNIKAIWAMLSRSEQKIMQHIARNGQKSFTADDIDIEHKHHLLRDLKRLVDRQILNYREQYKHYTVRLGLLTDLIAYGILS